MIRRLRRRLLPDLFWLLLPVSPAGLLREPLPSLWVAAQLLLGAFLRL